MLYALTYYAGPHYNGTWIWLHIFLSDVITYSYADFNAYLCFHKNNSALKGETYSDQRLILFRYSHILSQISLEITVYSSFMWKCYCGLIQCAPVVTLLFLHNYFYFCKHTRQYNSLIDKVLIDQIKLQITQCTCPISHNAPFRREMCTFFVLNGALWDMGQVHYEICGIGLLYLLHALNRRLQCGNLSSVSTRVSSSYLGLNFIVKVLINVIHQVTWF